MQYCKAIILEIPMVSNWVKGLIIPLRPRKYLSLMQELLKHTQTCRKFAKNNNFDALGKCMGILCSKPYLKYLGERSLYGDISNSRSSVHKTITTWHWILRKYAECPFHLLHTNCYRYSMHNWVYHRVRRMRWEAISRDKSTTPNQIMKLCRVALSFVNN